MNKIFASVILFGGLAASVFSQDFGTAVQDQMRAPLVNPAAMGVGNGPGIAFSQSYDEEGVIEKDYDLLFSLGPLAYSYIRRPGESAHLVAGGMRWAEGLYSGASYSWAGKGDGDSRWGLSLLYRPRPALSLALKGEDLGGDAYSVLGIGLRPLPTRGPLLTRLTFSGDLKIDEDGLSRLQLGTFLEPLNGFKIFGNYDVEEKNLNLGVSFAFSHLEAGIFNPEADWKEGRYHVYNSFKKQRGLIMPGNGRALEYDEAQVISDNPLAPEGGRSLMDFIRDMEAVKYDRSIKALIFRNQQFRTSFANLLEIETILKEVKSAGKRIYFYYDSLENLPYALAAAVGDEIYLNPAGTVNVKGFSSSQLYLKDFLADWGIRFQNFRSHPYKTAGNGFSEAEMSEAERESLEYFLGGLHEEMVRMLESGRGEQLSLGAQEALDEGPYLYAGRALEMGLVDGLLYEDEFDEMLEKRRLSTGLFSEGAAEMRYQWENVGRPIIALIYAGGGIHRGTGIAGQSIGSDSLVAAIRSARENPLVQAIVLRIDSGGGSTLASDQIAREVALCRSGENAKPLIVSMGGAAASGGYYIAAPAERIIASPGTVTGSIGVIALLPEAGGLLEKFRIGTAAVNTSEGADMGSPLRALTPEEQEKMERYIAQAYERFIALVAENRDMTVEEVHEQAQGRVWTGGQALERGLVDETGGLTQALIVAAGMINSRRGVRVIEAVPGRMPGLMEHLLPALTGGRTPAAQLLPKDLQSLLDFYGDLRQFEEGETLYLMPYGQEELGTAP